MSKQYLLPCACGERIRIDMGQAGQTLVCQNCGATLEVPTMRAVRALEPAQPDSDIHAPPAWSARQGALFAGGLTVAVIALAIAGAVLVKRLQLDTHRPELPDYTQFNRTIDRLKPEEVWQVWYAEVEPYQLGTWRPHPYLLRRREARIWNSLLCILLVVAAAGTAATCTALAIKSPP